jgi:hypothetical protein
MSLLAIVAGLVGMVAFLAGPAAAGDDHLGSGGAYAENGSVASGTAVAINDSTASGDAVAIDGSVASGCSTAVKESTASGADHCKGDGHDHAGPAKAVHGGGNLALTGSSSASMVQTALIAFFAGLALVSLTHILRRQTT